MKKVLLLATLAAAQPINHVSAGFLKSLIEDSQTGPRAIMIDNLERARQTSPDLDELIRLLNLDAAQDGLPYAPLWHPLSIYKVEEQGPKLGSFFTFYQRAMRSIHLDRTPKIVADPLLQSWLTDSPEFNNTFVGMIKLLIRKQRENEMSILPFLNEFFGSPYWCLLTEEQMQDLMEQMFNPTDSTTLLDEEIMQLQQIVQAGIQRGLQETA